ncbi:hypothetical protein ASF24_15205 [Methylobacterium sp. Leaf86]|uniref:hypothetical protein n=1 Tax=Methylobacterium sp. Leaf86 TaxID=1736242 RepID=UPI0006F83F3F|nr:hypothetical protein [Methylobacterium sp. Leaf86]KQO57994.1 hypothetical protein ASF24_15205 [Methylobacterium sp. Leaf86]
MSSTSAHVCASAPARVVSEVDVRTLLRQGVDEAGSRLAFAQLHGVNANDVSSVLTGRKAPSRSLLRSIGVTRALVIEGGVPVW